MDYSMPGFFVPHHLLEFAQIHVHWISDAIQPSHSLSPSSPVQFSSVTQLCLILCNPMDCSTPGLPVHHYLLELAQTHIHWLSDAIWPSHSLLPPSPPVLNLSQHQGLFQWVSCLHQMIKILGVSATASVLPRSIQGWFPLRLTSSISLLSKGLSGVFSSTIVWRHQFFSSLPSLRSNSHNRMWPLGRL